MEKIINLAKTWTKPLNENKTTEPMLILASAFSNILQLTAKEKSLVQATVVNKRPPILATMLTNYEKVAHLTTENTGQGRFQSCKNALFAAISTVINIWYIKPVPSQQPMVKILHSSKPWIV